MKTYSKVLFILLFITVQLLSYDITPLPINLPESKVKLLVDEKVYVRDLVFLKGNYRHGEERGGVYAQIDKNLIDLSQTASTILFTRVLHVGNQGSGNFSYIGLFQQDKVSKKVQHVDSFLLGSKVKEIKVKEKDEILHITYLQHSPTQAMVEYPSELVELSLHVENDKLKRCISNQRISKFLNDKYQEEVGFRLVEGVNYLVDSFSDSKQKYYFIYFRYTQYFCGTGGCSGNLIVDNGIELQILEEFALLRTPFYAIKDHKTDMLKEIITPVSYINIDKWDTYYNVYNIFDKKQNTSIYPNDKSYKNIQKEVKNSTISITLFDKLDTLKACPDNTVDIFDEFNQSTELPKKFKEILIKFNQDLVDEQYHKAIGRFDETYYFNQLSFLSRYSDTKPINIKTLTKQFIKESMHLDNPQIDFNLEDIKTLKYLGVFQQDKQYDSKYLKFKIILKDNSIINAGYMYKCDDFSFFGASG